MKKSLYLMTVLVCLCVFACGCGDRKEAVLLENAVMQDKTASGEADATTADGGTVLAEASGGASGDTQAEATDLDQGTSVDGSMGTLFVFICGSVVNPGVYEVESGSRICDVLALAGGFAEGAGTDYLNLAEPVRDGQKVYVPTAEEAAVGITDAAASEGSQAQDAQASGSQADGKININTATKEVLVTLPGIGESKADSIIAYRTEHGGFSTIEEIMEIPGIKEAVFSKIKELITVG